MKTDRARLSPEDAIIILKASAIYASATVAHFASMSIAARNREAERVVAHHFDDLSGFLRTERKRLGIKSSWLP